MAGDFLAARGAAETLHCGGDYQLTLIHRPVNGTWGPKALPFGAAPPPSLPRESFLKPTPRFAQSWPCGGNRQ